MIKKTSLWNLFTDSCSTPVFSSCPCWMALFSIPRMLEMASNSNCSLNFCRTRFFTNLSQYRAGNDL